MFHFRHTLAENSPQSMFWKICAGIATIGAALYYIPRIWSALVQFSRFVVLFNQAAPVLMSMGVEFKNGGSLKDRIESIEQRLERIEAHVVKPETT